MVSNYAVSPKPFRAKAKADGDNPDIKMQLTARRGMTVASAAIAAALFSAPCVAFAGTNPVTEPTAVAATQAAASSAPATSASTEQASSNTSATDAAAGASTSEEKATAVATSTTQTETPSATSEPAAASEPEAPAEKAAASDAASSAEKSAASDAASTTEQAASTDAVAADRQVATAQRESSPATTQAKYVAESGSTSYESLEDALAACADKGTVSLLGDIDNISKAIDIAGKAVTIDGKGHVISRAAGYTGSIFTVASDGSLELEDVVIDGGASGWQLDWDNASGPGWYVDVPIIKGENDVVSTAPLVEVAGKLSTHDTTLQNAYTESNIGGILVHGGTSSVLELGQGSVFKHAASAGNVWNWVDGAVRAEAGSSVTIDGATFTDNGIRSGGGALVLAGGAAEKRTTIKNSTFSSNFAHYNGGGIFCDASAIDISDSKFLNNAIGNDGGDICMEWGMSGAKSTGLAGQDSHFANVVFKGTRGLATGGQSMGGVFYTYYHHGGKLIFDNCTFDGSSAAAGAISDLGAGTSYTDTSDPANPKKVEGPLEMEFTNCTFTNNSANDGGVFYLQEVDATLKNCTLENNHARYDGGIALVGYPSSLTLEGCTVKGNSADSRGGVIFLYGRDNYGPKLVVGKGTTLTGNTALLGGAIYVLGSNSLTKETDISCVLEPGSHVYGNSATKGGDDIVAMSNKYGRITLQLDSGGFVDGTSQPTDGWYRDSPSTRYERNVSGKLSDTTLKVDPDNNKGLIYLKTDASNYVVVFHPGSDDATGSMDDQTLWMSGGILSANRFAKKGYRFAGWATEPDGSVVFADAAQVDALTDERGGIVDLYAVWEKEPEPVVPDVPETPESPEAPARSTEPVKAQVPAKTASDRVVSDAGQAVPNTGDTRGSAPAGILASLGAALAALGLGARRRTRE